MARMLNSVDVLPAHPVCSRAPAHERDPMMDKAKGTLEATGDVSFLQADVLDHVLGIDAVIVLGLCHGT